MNSLEKYTYHHLSEEELAQAEELMTDEQKAEAPKHESELLDLLKVFPIGRIHLLMDFKKAELVSGFRQTRSSLHDEEAAAEINQKELAQIRQTIATMDTWTQKVNQELERPTKVKPQITPPVKSLKTPKQKPSKRISRIIKDEFDEE